MAPDRRTRRLQEAEPNGDQFPHPTGSAGWRELVWGFWLILVALAITLFSGLWWATAWPEPKGIAVIRLQLGFALPLAIAWLGGLLAVSLGLFGLVNQKLGGFRSSAPERPAPRRTLRRAY